MKWENTDLSEFKDQKLIDIKVGEDGNPVLVFENGKIVVGAVSGCEMGEAFLSIGDEYD